jgi:hypothetical protein
MPKSKTHCKCHNVPLDVCAMQYPNDKPRARATRKPSEVELVAMAMGWTLAVDNCKTESGRAIKPPPPSDWWNLWLQPSARAARRRHARAFLRALRDQR